VIRSRRRPPRHPLSAAARGLGALVVLAAVVGGVPAALVAAVGWPLPTEGIDPAVVVDALRHGGVAPRTVAKVLAVVVWLAWLPVVAAVGREVAARLGAARRHGGGHGPLARAVSALVGWAGLLGSLTGTARPALALPLGDALAPLDHGPVAMAPVFPDAEVAAGPAPGPGPRPASARPGAAPVGVPYVVQPRDTLWGIAEATLGAGERWAEVARLNLGRTVAPGIVFGTATERLRAGWVLLVPGDAPGDDPAEPTGGPTAAPEVIVVAPGDTLWSLAGATYGDPRAWPTLWDANRGRAFDGQVFDDPGLIRPGWPLLVPRPGAAAPAPVTAPAPVEVPPAAPAPGAEAPAEPRTHLDGALPCPVVTEAPTPASVPGTAPVTVPGTAEGSRTDTGLGAPHGAAAVLMASGAAAAIAVRRRRRARTAAAGHRLPRPDPDLDPVHAAVAAGNRPLALARLDAALRGLAGTLATTGTRHATRVLAVTVGDDGALEVVLDGAPDHVPAPWRPGPTGDRIVVDPAVPLAALAAEHDRLSAPCPGLVHLGRSDDGDVFVDLEAVGVLGLGGPDGAAHAVARGLLAGLTLSPWADVAEVIVSGIDPLGLEPARLRTVEPTAVVGACELATVARRPDLDATGTPSAFLWRGDPDRGDGDLWEPVLAVAGPLDELGLRRLRTAAGRGGLGVAAVGAAVPWRLEPVPGARWRLAPLGIELTPAGLSADELADLAAALADADRPAEVVALPAAPPAPPGPGPARGRGPRIRVLGPVEVVDPCGDPVPVGRGKALELLTWLVLHRGRPLRRDARAALWSVEVADGTFHNVVSEARRTLARAALAPPGADWLARTTDATLTLHPDVTSDLDEFRLLVAGDRLADAAALVRGVPFAGASWWWLDAEACAVDVTLEVVDVLMRLAAIHAEAGRAEEVLAVTARGLSLLPGHDGLVGWRLRAHAARASRAGILQEFAAYERVSAADGTDPSPALVALRAELLRRLDAAAAATPR
jgi:hypothetical protein